LTGNPDADRIFRGLWDCLTRHLLTYGHTTNQLARQLAVISAEMMEETEGNA
jgi:hypothetical protein